MKLTSLQLSFRVISRVEEDAAKVLTQMHSLSCLARLQELTIMCHFRPYIYMQNCISNLQSGLQAHLKEARVQVTSLAYLIEVLPVAQS